MESIREPESVKVVDGRVIFVCPWSGLPESHPTQEGQTEWTVVSSSCTTSQSEADDPSSGPSILKIRIILP